MLKFIYLSIAAAVYLVTSYYIEGGGSERESVIVIRKGDDVMFDYLRGEITLHSAADIGGNMTRKQLEHIVKGQLARIEISKAMENGECPKSTLLLPEDRELICDYIQKSDDAFHYIVAVIKKDQQ